jgi:hypothetical protein
MTRDHFHLLLNYSYLCHLNSSSSELMDFGVCSVFRPPEGGELAVGRRDMNLSPSKQHQRDSSKFVTGIFGSKCGIGKITCGSASSNRLYFFHRCPPLSGTRFIWPSSTCTPSLITFLSLRTRQSCAQLHRIIQAVCPPIGIRSSDLALLEQFISNYPSSHYFTLHSISTHVSKHIVHSDGGCFDLEVVDGRTAHSRTLFPRSL